MTYESDALDAALEIAPLLSGAEFIDLQCEVARHALDARAHDVDVLAIAREVATIAANGLRAIAPAEVALLDGLRQRCEDGVAPADILINDSHGDARRAIELVRVA